MKRNLTPLIVIVTFAVGLVLVKMLGTTPAPATTPTLPTITQPAAPRYHARIEETYRGEACTVDCGGHRAGYEWAERHGISSESDCNGKSESFNEACRSFVRGN